MAQQINLYSPILLAPKRYFSAATMAQALGALVALLLAAGLWTAASTAQLAREMAASARFHDAERARLSAELVGRASPARDTAALEQALAAEHRALAERRALRDELQRTAAGGGHAALLVLLARTLPEPLWLTEVHVADGRLTVRGHALRPEALQPWLGRLDREPLLAAQQLRLVQVERQAGGAGGGESWRFEIAGAPRAPAPERLAGREAP